MSATTDSLQETIAKMTAELQRRDEELEALRQSEKLYRLTLEHIRDTVVLTDKEGRLNFVCPNADHITGLTAGEILESGTIGGFLGHDPASNEAFNTQGEVLGQQIAYRHPSGATKYLDVNVRAVEFAAMSRLYTFHDVTELKEAEMALASTKRFLQTMLNNINDAVFFVRPRDRTIIYCNRGVQRVLGYRPDDLIGETTRIIYRNDDEFTEFKRLSERALERSKRYRAEFPLRHADGRTITAEIHITGLAEGGAWEGGVISVIRDVTQHKQLERAIALVTGVSDLIAEASSFQDAVSRALERIHKTTSSILTEAWCPLEESPDFARIASHGDGGDAATHCQAILEGSGFAVERRLISKLRETGNLVWMGQDELDELDVPNPYRGLIEQICGIPVQAGGRLVAAFVFFFGRVHVETEAWMQAVAATVAPLGTLLQRFQLEDELRRHEAEISDSRNRIRNLAVHLQEAIETERKEIAREIHDDLGSMLTSIRLDVDSILADHRPAVGRHQKTLQATRDTVNRAVESVQRLSASLRPPLLEEFGLISAMQSYADEISKHRGIAVEFDCRVREWAYRRKDDDDIFRIFQESITNILRHAEATTVMISIRSREDLLEFVIEDDGNGIDPGSVTSARSLGLIGMRERTSRIGGQLTIERTESGGTRVCLRVPAPQRKTR